MEADDVSDLFVEGKGIPWDKQDPEAPKSISAERIMSVHCSSNYIYGKRGVYKDTKLQERGGRILEKDGIVYCIMQLITVLESNLHLYYKKGKGNAIKEFGSLFEELTGNEFEPWEREKKFEKKRLSFYPIDMDDGVDARHGGLRLRQLGVAAVHRRLEPKIAYFMKILCSREIYRYAMMEKGCDSPDLPMGMLSNFHMERCEDVLLWFVEAGKSTKETGQKAEAGAAAFETVRDINVAPRLIGDMSGSALDDPLSDRYMNWAAQFRVGDIDYGVSVENIFPVEPSACPPLVEIKKLPNKVVLWCGTRSSNMLRHLQKGFLPSVCSLPVPGDFCSDAAAEAGRYGFTAVDRPEGFLALAVASLGDQVIKVESPLERKTTDESEHFLWKDDIKVPCGRLIPSVHKDSPLEYNEYAIYDPKQTSIRFLMDTAEP
uniref:Poly [ADP-ribose] polymerase n=1 Tax=Populus trichocarpa TaxID=3694 RepID=A0A2K2AWQ0_POPTR